MATNTQSPDGSPLAEETAFQRDLLRLVEKLDRPKGVELMAELEDLYGKEVHHGRIYPNLDDLVESGLVEKGEQDRRTNFYELTPRGQRELDAHRAWYNGEC